MKKRVSNKVGETANDLPKTAKKKTLDDMTVADVVKTDVFKNELQKIMDTLRIAREKARKERGANLKAHVIDRLLNKHWEVRRMANLFIGVMDKTVDREEFPSAMRSYIYEIGYQAFGNALKILSENERKNNN